uniref:Swi5-dependent recombination DNA repair protein 1 homolog n=1 Tax=Biomphalaria glabrata TaxID=6526 RepID=A0A2C9LHM7_BIOGL
MENVLENKHDKSTEQHSSKISSALKERLKKCGRYHTGSPSDPSASKFSTPNSKRKHNPPPKSGFALALKKRKLDYDQSVCDTSLPDLKECTAAETKKTNELVSKDENKIASSENTLPNCSLVENMKQKLLTEKRLLEVQLKEKNEILRKLKMVKMYREKNNLSELQILINTWRAVSQRALVDLHQLLPHPMPSLTELITNMHIDAELIHYNVEDESFT